MTEGVEAGQPPAEPVEATYWCELAWLGGGDHGDDRGDGGVGGVGGVEQGVTVTVAGERIIAV